MYSVSISKVIFHEEVLNRRISYEVLYNVTVTRYQSQIYTSKIVYSCGIEFSVINEKISEGNKVDE